MVFQPELCATGQTVGLRKGETGARLVSRLGWTRAQWISAALMCSICRKEGGKVWARVVKPFLFSNFTLPFGEDGTLTSRVQRLDLLVLPRRIVAQRQTLGT